MKAIIKSKINLVKSLAAELVSFKTVCVVDLERVPTSQLSLVKNELIGAKIIVMSKNIIRRALKESDKGLEGLVEQLKGSCALLLSNDGPFKVSIKLAALKVPALIKSGDLASNDVIVEAGPTTFMPGPMMTELTNLGIKVNPKGGKLSITEPATVVKAGSLVSRSVADLLFKLGVKPVSVGLSLLSAFDGINVFNADELFVDVQSIMSNLLLAQSSAINLSFNACVINSYTIGLLISKASAQARSLARETGIITNDNVGDIMLTANAKALALVNQINWEVKA
ncbi:MAG: 50S ribosomal protein L10 [Candidatus Nanoarchaeia archaeon]|jgi:large subunit ribosomal protein L10